MVLVAVLLSLLSILFSAGACLYVFAIRGKSPEHNGTMMFSAMERFTAQMEKENDQIIEMMGGLRQKIDADALAAGHAISGLRKDLERLEAGMQKLETFGPSDDSIAEPPPVPPFLSPKYQEVADRLLRAEDPSKIARDMQLGRGEVDLVARLINPQR